MKKHIRWLSWVILPLVVGMTAAAWRSGSLTYSWNTYVLGEPILEINSPLDLGHREYGELVTARFAVANRGRRELILDQFRTNCACHSLEYEVNGEAVRLTQLRLAPSEKKEMILRFSLRNPVGSRVLNTIYCRTNDPRMPEATFEAVIPQVTGGIFASPITVLFGTVPVGCKRQQIVEVRDNAAPHRHIAKVLSSNPELFSVRFVPRTSSDSPSSSEGGILLGRIEVILQARQLGPFSGEVKVYLDGDPRPPDSILVTGRTAPLVEASPPSILLPRTSNNGPLYSARCVCRSTTGEPLIVSVEKTSPDITATVDPRTSDHAASQVITVEWKPSASSFSGKSVDRMLRIRARIGKQVFPLDIPVQVERVPNEGS